MKKHLKIEQVKLKDMSKDKLKTLHICTIFHMLIKRSVVLGNRLKYIRFNSKKGLVTHKVKCTKNYIIKNKLKNSIIFKQAMLILLLQHLLIFKLQIVLLKMYLYRILLQVTPIYL